MAATTWNPSDKGTNITLSNGNLDASSAVATLNSVRATTSANAGKFYWEIAATTAQNNNNGPGLADSASGILSSFLGNVANSAGFIATGANEGPAGYFSYSNTAASFASGDVLMFAIDFGAGKAWAGKNNTWFSSGAPASGANPWCTFTAGSTLFPAATLFSSGTLRIKPNAASQTYSPPSGFVPWDSVTVYGFIMPMLGM